MESFADIFVCGVVTTIFMQVDLPSVLRPECAEVNKAEGNSLKNHFLSFMYYSYCSYHVDVHVFNFNDLFKDYDLL